MARKKKLPSQQKRQQVVDSQGWTHIIKGPNNHVSAQYANTALHRRLSNTNMSFTLETYLSKLQNHYIARWNESSCFNNLSRIFEQYISTIGTTSIANCVCLGLGSITAGVETPGFELAALMSMLKILGKTHTIREVIFQDPMFNSLDHAVFASLGYNVLTNPDAFSEISQHTFIFAPHLEFSAYATALEGAMPALCIGNDIEEYLNAPRISNESGKRQDNVRICQRYVNKTISMAMPDFERTPWCTSQRIYWARPEDKGTEGESRNGKSGASLDASTPSTLATINRVV